MPSACAAHVSGFTTWPESMAITKRWILSSPAAFTETSATPAVKLPKPSDIAMPRKTPAGSGVPQPACFAAASRTRRFLSPGLSIARRYSSGSFPAACASSSMKHSRYTAFCKPGARQKPTGTCPLRMAYSTFWLAMAYGMSLSVRTAEKSMPFWMASGRSSARMEGQAIFASKATQLPCASSPAFIRTRLAGR